jgi:hypothetical protein
MNADQVNTFGGFCELVGVGFVARDLISLASFRGRLAQLAAWFHVRRAVVVTALRRLLGRPRRQITVPLGMAGEVETAGALTVRVNSRPFVAQPGQSLQDQVAELASLANRLRDEVVREPKERERAMTAEREARRQELKGEAERLERLIAVARQEVERLREATTGDLGLRVESVAFLLGGIVFTTWPEWSADRFPGWPPFRVATCFLGTYLAARLSWALWLRPCKG